MPIIANGAAIPTNGNYIMYNGVTLDAVVSNGVEVWKKIISTPVTLTEWNKPWDSRVSFHVISGDKIDMKTGTINSHNGGFVIDIAFPTLGNRTLEINIDVAGYIEVYIGNNNVIIQLGAGENNGNGTTRSYDIAGSDNIRIRGHSCSQNGPQFLQFIYIKMY